MAMPPPPRPLPHRERGSNAPPGRHAHPLPPPAPPLPVGEGAGGEGARPFTPPPRPLPHRERGSNAPPGRHAQPFAFRPPLSASGRGWGGGVTALLALLALAAGPREPLKSGPQPVTARIGAFNPLNVTGPHAGKRHALVAAHGTRPAVLVLARATSPELTALIKKLEAATLKHQKAELAAFVVLCGDPDGKARERLEGLAKELALKTTTLALLPDAAGPRGYDFHPDADLQAILYARRNAKAQFAYKKGDLKDADADAVLAALPKVLPPARK